jgi:fumarate hydratase class II
MRFREEKDTMGIVKVPAHAYYGAQTQRAVENFPISGIALPHIFIQALAMIKRSAAEVNADLGLLDKPTAEAICQAAQEILAGRLEDQFVVDVFQTGSGTSTNMNMNEVLATRANEILTGKKATKAPVHPNDHVNRGQSSNDVIPTALHVAAMLSLENALLPALKKLHECLAAKAEEFTDVEKMGRTHLQDAVPMTLGQEFSGWDRQIVLGIDRLHDIRKRLSELALGGTAVGSGLNADPRFAPRAIENLARQSGIAFSEAQNHFEAQSARDAAVETSGVLKTVAVGLLKIANDIRWLASGPRCGLGEITIPALQPGSSIMPGKVNPVIPEAVIQVAAQVMGNDTAITVAGQSGNFQLNVTIPLIAHNLLQSMGLLASVVDVLAEKCIKGITANREKCAANVEQSLAMVTGLVPYVGYDRAAEIAEIAYESGRTIREVAVQEKVLPENQINRILDSSESGG